VLLSVRMNQARLFTYPNEDIRLPGSKIGVDAAKHNSYSFHRWDYAALPVMACYNIGHDHGARNNTPEVCRQWNDAQMNAYRQGYFDALR